MSVMRIRTFLLSLSVLICTTATSNAQDQNPIDILDASKAAIAEIEGFSAQFKMKGEGGAMFASTLPSVNGRLFFGTHEELGRVIHSIGEYKDQQSSPSQAMDILIASDRYLWTDHQQRTINERPTTGSTRGLPSSFPLILISSITQEDPYARDADGAQAITLLAQETIGDTFCDVIHIKRAKPDTKRSPSDAYTDAVWYIGVNDRLPRKVEHITDAGMVKITLALELSSLKLESPAKDMLDITRPDGYQFKSRMPKPKTESEDETENNTESDPITTRPTPRDTPSITTNEPAAPRTPRVRRAPSYAFKTSSQSEIDNSTQDGRITVFYFWGSWCVPCQTASPLVSQLANDFATDIVDIFALAVREADLDQVESDFNDDGYKHSLVLESDHMVGSFKARVFPTIVVINQTGEIVFQKGIGRDMSSEELVAEARSAIETELTGS